MDRRNFLRLGTGALIAPSLIWPFRKIFLPLAGGRVVSPLFEGFEATPLAPLWTAFRIPIRTSARASWQFDMAGNCLGRGSDSLWDVVTVATPAELEAVLKLHGPTQSEGWADSVRKACPWLSVLNSAPHYTK